MRIINDVSAVSLVSTVSSAPVFIFPPSPAVWQSYVIHFDNESYYYLYIEFLYCLSLSLSKSKPFLYKEKHYLCLVPT